MCVFEMGEVEHLDLSVNNLEQLPSQLWRLPLHELNLSHNSCLGRVLLPALEEAAQCTHLKTLKLRDVVTAGEEHGSQCEAKIYDHYRVLMLIFFM